MLYPYVSVGIYRISTFCGCVITANNRGLGPVEIFIRIGSLPRPIRAIFDCNFVLFVGITHASAKIIKNNLIYYSPITYSDHNLEN